MTTDTHHRALIAVAKIQTAGRIDDTVAALLARIEELEAEQDEQDLEFAHLRAIETLALKAAAIGAKIGCNPSLRDAERAVEAIWGLSEDMPPRPGGGVL